MYKYGLKALFSSFVTTLAISFCAQASSLSRVFIAGDGPAAVFGPDQYPEFGWGQMLPCGLHNAQVLDYARPGITAERFVTEGRLKALAAQLHDGDTLLIAFGDIAPVPQDDGVAFQHTLMQFITAARSHGAVPVLVTPAGSLRFSAKNPAAPSVRAVTIRQLAQEHHIALIDLDRMSRRWLGRLGAQNARRYYLDRVAKLPWPTPEAERPTTSSGWLPWQHTPSESVRFQELGARAMADLVAQSLARLPIALAGHVLAARPSLARPVPAGSAICR